MDIYHISQNSRNRLKCSEDLDFITGYSSGAMLQMKVISDTTAVASNFTAEILQA
jgi:hypothetical protein